MDTNSTVGGQGGAKLSLRSISSLFSETWKLYKERWSVLVEIVLLPTLVVALGYVLLGLRLGFPFSFFGGLIVFAGYVIFIFSILPVVYSIHNATGVDASYKAAIGWFWPFIWATILEVLAVMGGFFMLIIPGIWLSFALAFFAYVFVMEDRRGIDALRQSKDYIKGYWWAVAGRILLLGVVFLAATIVVEIPVMIIAGNAARVLVSMIMALFFFPFSAIYHYVIFGNLRELKPERAEIQTKEGTGFLKASAIVGIVAPILVFIAAIVLVVMGIFYVVRHADPNAFPPGYAAPTSPLQQ